MPKANSKFPITNSSPKLKVAIVCDWLSGTGGAERVVLELHKMFPNAPIYTSQYDSNPKIWYGDKWFSDADIRTSWLQKLPKGLRKFLPVLRAWSFSRLNLSGYDLVISSSGAEAKGIRTTPKPRLIRNWKLGIRKSRGSPITNYQLPTTKKSSFIKLRSLFTRADVAQGDSEQRTEAYIKYGEGAAELATQRDAANSGSAGGSASRQGTVAGKQCVHISYIHAPTHYYWSRYEQYLKNPGFGLLDPLARLGLRLLVGPMRRWDKKASARPDFLLCNSAHTKNQIKKYYGREAEVIYPPVDTERFKPVAVQTSKATWVAAAQGADENRKGDVQESTSTEAQSPQHSDPAASTSGVAGSAGQQVGAARRFGFVTAGRQTPYKRIDLAVAACTKLNLPLTVIGNGPEHDKLTKIAGTTVEFLTGVPDEDMPLYFQKAEGFIFPGVDDFGIVAVEALSAGTPVIAYKDGGALDYVNSGTGLFFSPQSTDALVQQLEEFSSKKFNHENISENANSFSLDKFHVNMTAFIHKVMKGKR